MRTSLIAAALASALLAGCDRAEQKSVKDLAPKKTDLGTGLNAVERSYARPAPEMVDTARAVFQSLDLTIESDMHDALGGEIVARRADGHKVTAKVTSRDDDHADVAVRVAPGNRPLAEMIQDRIAQKSTELPAK